LPWLPRLADCLEAVLELDAACKVKKCSEEASLLFGIAAADLVQHQIQKASVGVGEVRVWVRSGWGGSCKCSWVLGAALLSCPR
jgi:hypothetical protein